MHSMGWRRIVIAGGLVALAVLGGIYVAGRGWLGTTLEVGPPTAARIPAQSLATRDRAQLDAAVQIGVDRSEQILFGDLHVHSGFSADAYVASLPLGGGDGAYTVSDACDFARLCSGLDFWSINDHAIGSSPRRWRQTIESIRQCNTIGSGGGDPDMVAFLGWEWTQIGSGPENHYGHKNVVLRHLDDGHIPTRPIAADSPANPFRGIPTLGLGLLPILEGDRVYFDAAADFQEMSGVPRCPDGVPVRALPDTCREFAATPAELFAKLDDWGHEAMVIPHGTTWGTYTPPGSSWEKQLRDGHHDPERQRLIEIYSGHGNTEEYRPHREVALRADGRRSCPDPVPGHRSSCQQAGEIIRERCLQAGETIEICDARAAAARQLWVDTPGVSGHLVVGGSEAEEWLDSGQCSDCFQPAFNHRTPSSVQAILAYRALAPSEPADRFRFGIIASSDSHTARPGTGYKEYARVQMSDARMSRISLPGAVTEPPAAEARPVIPWSRPATDWMERERLGSFFYTGGLVAAHAGARSREAIWEALERRTVYATSGPRILLWFDILNPGGDEASPAPMGSETRMGVAPAFRVRAVGSLEQQPGCPEHSLTGLTASRLERLCRGECHNPGDQRRLITRIEVIRIQPQILPGEPLEPLIEDPWRVFTCPSDPAGCSVEFRDQSFGQRARDTLYYVRAIEAPAPAINAGTLRCERDAEGRCIQSDPCWGESDDDDCLAPSQARAWSSPVFVDYVARPPAFEEFPEAPAAPAGS
ncbi:MAG: DUF3604 domain-containing protein [Deltaproteobacteria bacterium]|nr:DUF3604 domain-containing protein [Deltaproteobacteria bacterium]